MLTAIIELVTRQVTSKPESSYRVTLKLADGSIYRTVHFASDEAARQWVADKGYALALED